MSTAAFFMLHVAIFVASVAGTMVFLGVCLLALFAIAAAIDDWRDR